MSEERPKDMVRISFDSEVETLLRENDVDLFDMLRKDPTVSGRFSRIAAVEFPVPQASGGERIDPLTIAASATVIVALGSAIERIIKVLTRRPVLLEREHYGPTLDAEGKPVLGADGKPIMSKATTQTYEESIDPNAPAWETHVTASELRIVLGKAST